MTPEELRKERIIFRVLVGYGRFRETGGRAGAGNHLVDLLFARR